MTVYRDAADLPEDVRIDLIGKHASSGKRVAFVVEDDEKADRYMRKLKEKFPNLKEIERGNGPVEGVIYVKVGPVTAPPA
jgi:hypothetical protein